MEGGWGDKVKGRGEGEKERQKKKGGECVGNRAKREAPRRNRAAREGRLADTG